MVEGYAYGTRPQLIRCLRIAFGSACELKIHLSLAVDLKLTDEDAGKATYAECDRLVGLLIGLLRKLGAEVPT
jgi:four helix bundle protein